ncbi:tumor necrosis factor receptor superfamily member 14 [Hemicordylus capensis]|uniref:tumor necrosis factor receptor superfamily member 14 n=1 Tax=Hemicordylus capensis TaxID=884348 RepID=UPI002304D09A|nr:tumor necrosis factor receptor superfamily member 14 [Hemicordylus capensis]
MLLVSSLILATQLIYLEAITCKAFEYKVNEDCCPKCAAGLRVLNHCTENSGNTCVPCTEGTYTKHPNGLEECILCQVCDPGVMLRIKQPCTYVKDTVCACVPGSFCIHLIDENCEHCQKHTISPPGFMVTEYGTETADTKFEPCPHGTFAATEMSPSCKTWTNCSDLGMIAVRAGNRTSDNVCEFHSPNITLRATIAIVAGLLVGLSVVIVLVLVIRKRMLLRKGTDTEQGEAHKEFLPVPETETNMVNPMQETSLNPGEPTYKVA